MAMREVKEIIKSLPPPRCSISSTSSHTSSGRHRDLDLDEDVLGVFKNLAFQADEDADWIFGNDRMDRRNDDILEDTDYLPEIVGDEGSVLTDMDFLMILSSSRRNSY